MNTTRRIGNVGVDSGMLRIIDPCYTPDETYAERLDEGLFPTFEQIATPVTTEPLGIPLGLDIGSFGGDGMYPVFALVDPDGQVLRVTINFRGVAP